MLRAVAATTTGIGTGTTAGPLIQRFGARIVIVGMWALAMLAAPLGTEVATAQPIQWAGVADCYDRGVYEQKPIVMLLYDKVTSRVSLRRESERRSNGPSRKTGSAFCTRALVSS